MSMASRSGARRGEEYGSIRVMARRCKREGVPLAECAIRRLVKEGAIPAIYIGNKAILSWGNVIGIVKNGMTIKPQEPAPQYGVIRRVG